MAQLQSTNVTGTLCVNGVAIGGGKDFKFCCFTGSTSWTPSSGLVSGDGTIDSILVGGGGGGGGAYAYSQNRSWCFPEGLEAVADAIGGGGGQVYAPMISIDSTDACTVTVGAGGIGGYVYDDPTCTAYQKACTEIRDASTVGGTTSFAGYFANGGGGGSSKTCGKCFCRWTNFQCGQQCVQKTYDGVKGSGGSSYLGSDEITLCNAEGIADTYNTITGSGNIYNTTTLGRGINIDNGTFFGSAGGQSVIGGRPTGQGFATGSSPFTDPSVVTSYCALNEDNLNIAATSSNTPSKFYGAGGLGGYAHACSSGTTYVTCAGCVNARGAEGNTGIVVIKWYE